MFSGCNPWSRDCWNIRTEVQPLRLAIQRVESHSPKRKHERLSRQPFPIVREIVEMVRRIVQRDLERRVADQQGSVVILQHLLQESGGEV